MDAELSPSAIERVDDTELFEAAVAEYRESAAHIEGLSLRPLGSGLKSLIWGLRLYVLFMVVVVILNIVQTLH
ncbi:hypothetical protein HIJ39_10975 [Sulfobacillus sp. DSM 109850]|uniref:Uncharacterized protein n=2 Tax=Sulfobacillus harzensis TaxID=2729629 RepID=A0A7Y0L542_9FIRM|nr:hypothetical protein [Sulfobacillus harzensis]